MLRAVRRHHVAMTRYTICLWLTTQRHLVCACAKPAPQSLRKVLKLNAANVVSLTANAPAFESSFDVGIKEARCLFAYDTRSHNTAADRVIYSLKRATNRDATVFLSRLLAERISSDFTREGRDIRAFTIAYAPRRPASIREYGSDHMKAVAKETACILGIERADLLSQKSHLRKNAHRRQKSARREKGYALRHSASPSIQGKSFILIDDIITTGATLAACVSLLKSADVGKICVYCIAKSK